MERKSASWIAWSGCSSPLAKEAEEEALDVACSNALSNNGILLKVDCASYPLSKLRHFDCLALVVLDTGLREALELWCRGFPSRYVLAREDCQ